MKRVSSSILAMVAGGFACGKPSSQAAPEPSTVASASIPAASGDATGAASARATPAPVSSWRGPYTSVAGALTLPKNVSWRVPESALGLGDGTISLTVDSATGRVQGTVQGPLGPATLDGLASEGHLTANMARQDPSDHGFIGTLAADVRDGGAQGTLNAAVADVSAVRTATFRLSPVRGAGDAP